MVKATFRPRLRLVETIAVPDREHGRVLVLRDTQGIASGHAVLPPPLAAVVAGFDGRRTCAEIARDLASELSAAVPEEIVIDLAAQLDEALFLEGPTFERALDAVRREFAESPLRAASHAGGAYPGTGEELRSYIDERCLGAVERNSGDARLCGLIAPHIDPWRGAVSYGHAYRALASAIPKDAETFLLLGTSHAPMREPFALCDKGFDTPYGVVEAHHAAIAELARAARFDAFADQLNHKREHSLEFQAVFLRHVLGDRPIKIIPVLAGLGEQQASGKNPREHARVAAFLDALGELCERERAIVIAGADLAHVGPRFGDPRPFDQDERAALEQTDRGSLERAAARDAAEFWDHVAADLDTRRVCGLAPIFSLLEALPRSRGELLHYEQTIDEQDGSIVSHAAVGFFLDP